MESYGNPDTRPSFYQIMLHQNLTELKIPTKFFNNHLASEEIEVVTLRSSGRSWDVKLTRRDDSMCLVQGWPDFVESHSLGSEQLAVFIYNGGMSFDVKIYGRNGWLINYETAASQQGVRSPFFRHKMRRRNVGKKCTMLIPKNFSRTYLPMSRQTLLLRDSDGVSWTVTTIVTSKGLLALSGGWKAFTDAHSIKKGDACIFELIEEKVMKVHILR